jgi:CheY-like chemotaxis protein/HPt (histidine-containing phosphotransfer) domain-containing protein
MPMRVLVIDDDALSREVLELLLGSEGYEVETADSGDAALLRLRAANGPLPQVVLADMQMPGTSGAELARQLRIAGRGEMALVAMSGSEPDEAERVGFDEFLLKPFTMSALKMAISGGLQRSEEVVREIVVVDEEVYRKLAESMQRSQLEKLYALCVSDAERRVEAMRGAASKGDDAAYRREAHAIKGGCGMVGAIELQTLATSMEMRGLDANHVASLDELMLASERLRRILIAHENEDRATGLSGEDTYERSVEEV